MTLAVVFRRAASREFDTAALWYEERRTGLGTEFISEIERAIGLVAKNPERFPTIYRDIRRVAARRFPYAVFFRAEATRIVVLAVFHARRNPTVWQRRA